MREMAACGLDCLRRGSGRLGSDSNLSRAVVALEVGWLDALGIIFVALLFPGLYAVAIIYFSILLQYLYNICFPITTSIMLAPFIVYCFSKERDGLIIRASHYLSPKEIDEAIDYLLKTANKDK